MIENEIVCVFLIEKGFGISISAIRLNWIQANFTFRRILDQLENFKKSTKHQMRWSEHRSKTLFFSISFLLVSEFWYVKSRIKQTLYLQLKISLNFGLWFCKPNENPNENPFIFIQGYIS